VKLTHGGGYRRKGSTTRNGRRRVGIDGVGGGRSMYKKTSPDRAALKARGGKRPRVIPTWPERKGRNSGALGGEVTEREERGETEWAQDDLETWGGKNTGNEVIGTDTCRKSCTKKMYVQGLAQWGRFPRLPGMPMSRPVDNSPGNHLLEYPGKR